mgnify:CR=1 FL=1
MPDDGELNAAVLQQLALLQGIADLAHGVDIQSDAAIGLLAELLGELLAVDILHVAVILLVGHLPGIRGGVAGVVRAGGGGGVVVAASSQQGHDHQAGQRKGKNSLFHCVILLKYMMGVDAQFWFR